MKNIVRLLMAGLLTWLVAASIPLAFTGQAQAALASAPHFIVHTKREMSGQYKGWMRYDVQSSRHWAYDRIWLQCIAPGQANVGFVTTKRKTADREGHVVYHTIARAGHQQTRCQFYSPPAPGYPVEKSTTFLTQYTLALSAATAAHSHYGQTSRTVAAQIGCKNFQDNRGGGTVYKTGVCWLKGKRVNVITFKNVEQQRSWNIFAKAAFSPQFFWGNGRGALVVAKNGNRPAAALGARRLPGGITHG